MKKFLNGAIAALLISCVFSFTAQAADHGKNDPIAKAGKIVKHTVGKKAQTGVSLLVNIVNGTGCARPYRIIVYRLDNNAVVRDVANWNANAIRFDNLPIGPRFLVAVYTSSCSGSSTSPSSGGLSQSVTVTVRR